MKKLLITISILILAGLTLIAQPPHPNQGSSPAAGNSPVGGGAPIDGGTVVLIVLATAWAYKKSGIVFFTKTKNQSL